RSTPRANAGQPDEASGAPPVSPSVVDRFLPAGVSAETLDNRALLRWMFRFISPVKGLALIACLYTAFGVAAEVLTTRQIGQAVDHIKNLHVMAGTIAASASGFWTWISGNEPQATTLRRLVAVLFGLVALMSVLRYLREVANSKFSMNM